MSHKYRILVADSGSSKTEWRIIGDSVAGKSIYSSGINPYFLNSNEIFTCLKNEISEISRGRFDRIFFYGTGCNSSAKEDIVKSALERFTGCSDIFVGRDLLGAARSLCMDKPGIACIMGTGSNSCYYDGKEIVSNIPPLGYILGDEGGGAVLGRKLLSGILKMKVPEEVRKRFYSAYNINTAEILDNVYTKPFPNRFLGQFSKFLHKNIEIPELRDIVISSFDDFITRNVLQYPESSQFPVHFTGSIAFYFRDLLTGRVQKYGLEAGKITLSPMEDLVRYHLNFMITV